MQKMAESSGLPVFWVILLMVVSFSANIYGRGDSYNSKGYVWKGRQTRSLTAVPGPPFQILWRKILKHAIFHRRNNVRRVYSKNGGLDQAVDDFYALNPTSVNKAKDNELVGRAGRYRIRLVRANVKGEPTPNQKSEATLSVWEEAVSNSGKVIFYTKP